MHSLVDSLDLSFRRFAFFFGSLQHWVPSPSRLFPVGPSAMFSHDPIALVFNNHSRLVATTLDSTDMKHLHQPQRAPPQHSPGQALSSLGHLGLSRHPRPRLLYSLRSSKHPSFCRAEHCLMPTLRLPTPSRHSAEPNRPQHPYRGEMSPEFKC